ncbi:glycerol dehydratase reactivase beta/small subunit family protein [Prauserella oleivorans]|uniref:Glycerol dehydratase reactivase beta/small subunit family protein n=1 Tax=Prauserella oleivorans TaxID=1478153 RepID=A0ABW5WJG0_9PSEU
MSIVDRRAENARRTPPCVVARCAGDDRLREVRAGLEEEGVPLRVEAVASGDAVELAYEAALASSLGVGIGIDAAGGICVHHAKRPRESPVLTAVAAQARLCGHDAARLVVGLPLKTPSEERENPWPDN